MPRTLAVFHRGPPLGAGTPSSDYGQGAGAADGDGQVDIVGPIDDERSVVDRPTAESPRGAASANLERAAADGGRTAVVLLPVRVKVPPVTARATGLVPLLSALSNASAVGAATADGQGRSGGRAAVGDQLIRDVAGTMGQGSDLLIEARQVEGAGIRSGRVLAQRRFCCRRQGVIGAEAQACRRRGRLPPRYCRLKRGRAWRRRLWPVLPGCQVDRIGQCRREVRVAPDEERDGATRGGDRPGNVQGRSRIAGERNCAFAVKRDWSAPGIAAANGEEGRADGAAARRAGRQ